MNGGLKKSIAFFLLFALCIGMISCGNGERATSLEFKSFLDEDERAYYTGQEFDSYVECDGELYCRIPCVYAVYGDGTLSDDISHYGCVTYSGYDLSLPGQQTVSVIFNDGGRKIKANYPITVIETEIIDMDVRDTLHYTKGAFCVGEKFSTYSETEDGVRRGVSVILSYNDPSREDEVLFAGDEKLDGIIFDTSECRLDADGRFTKAGIYEVTVYFGEFVDSYFITVTEN